MSDIRDLQDLIRPGVRAPATLMAPACVACGKTLSEDSARVNFAGWTYAEPGVQRLPYCAESIDCALDAHERVRLQGLP